MKRSPLFSCCPAAYHYGGSWVRLLDLAEAPLSYPLSGVFSYTHGMTRTAIAGVPKAGKTTLAYTFPGPLLHTDDVIHLGWSEASAEVATWFDRPDWRVIEGVAVPRALRKWLRSHADGRPCDQLIYLASYRQRPTREQEIMGRGCFSVMLEISPTLQSRGVTIEWR